MVFNEDQSRNRKDNCPVNLALPRKLALNLARLEPSGGSMRGKVKRAGWDNRYLAIGEPSFHEGKLCRGTCRTSTPMKLSGVG